MEKYCHLKTMLMAYLGGVNHAFLGHTVVPEHLLRAPLYSQTCSNLENKVTLYLGTLRLAFLNTLTFSPICLHSVSCSVCPCCPQEMHNKYVLNKKIRIQLKMLKLL